MLLLDEITASLPADLSERIYAMVRHWRERGNAVIFISHRMAEVADLCDRATVLRDGVTVGVTERAHGSEERIVALMLGAETARAVAAASSTPASFRAPRDGQAALEVRGLRRSPLLNDVSFKLYPGEVLGVAASGGPGAGGTVRLHRGQSPLRRRRHSRTWQGIETSPSGGRDPRGHRSRAGQPAVGAAAAALDSGKHRAARLRRHCELGADQDARRASARRTRR